MAADARHPPRRRPEFEPGDDLVHVRTIQLRIDGAEARGAAGAGPPPLDQRTHRRRLRHGGADRRVPPVDVGGGRRRIAVREIAQAHVVAVAAVVHEPVQPPSAVMSHRSPRRGNRSVHDTPLAAPSADAAMCSNRSPAVPVSRGRSTTLSEAYAAIVVCCHPDLDPGLVNSQTRAGMPFTSSPIRPLNQVSWLATPPDRSIRVDVVLTIERGDRRAASSVRRSATCGRVPGPG